MMSASLTVAENIDPANDDSQHAYAENVGWINAEPNGDGGSGIQVGDSELSGWMWAENVGWVSLSCRNTLSCAALDYGVANDGNGFLSGYAWAENVGWVNFAPFSSGVVIDPATGEFSGYAWAENVGWISFNCANTGTCGEVDYKVKTGWICDPPPPPPLDVPTLTMMKSESDVLLTWTRVPGATQYDIVVGDLGALRSSGGDFALATTECLADNCTTDGEHFDPGSDPFEGQVVMVRGTNCGGNGTYDTGGISQVGLRDAEIAASGNDCW
jgi:hypothetical protein